jgi:trehalose 6-phosphate synthase/phosphatase
MTASLVIVSNRLPISVKKTENGLEYFPSIGGLATGLAGFAEDKKFKWVGWPGITSDKLTDKDINEIAEKLLANNCYPVFLTQKQIDGFYNGYSNSILWPLFHDLTIVTDAIKNQKIFWESYKKVNAIFADAILKICENDTNIWVNDYHLFLLPALLRNKNHFGKIGFFSHIPFPNAKKFLELKNAKELLLGVLGAELIGLHTKSYVRNFINSCQSLKIGLLTQDCIALDDRIIRISNFPMGIDYSKFDRTQKLKSVRQEVFRLQTKYQNKKIILTVDRLDPTKGLVERVSAYRNFLRLNSQLHGKIIMTMLVVPSRTQIPEYDNLRQQLEKSINEINYEFQKPNWKPVEYLYKCLSLEKLIALYKNADIAFIVPLKDGMNLVCKEYIACKPNGDGVLILSKTAGAAENLHDALIVDPTNPNSLVSALDQAVLMQKSESKKRLSNMHKHIADFTVQKWANNFINSLLLSPILPDRRTKSLNKKIQDKLIIDYSTAIKRVLLLDYDGTLTPFIDNPILAKPSILLKQQLKKLTVNKQNKIVIISGRDKSDLGKWFDNIPLTLVVEHGGFIRNAGEKQWHTNTTGINASWKPMIQNIFEQFVKKVPGSFVEQKEYSLVWHYRAAKQYYVNKYLSSLEILLRPLAQKLNLRIEHGSKILEVRPNGISKGNLALEFSQQADFVLAVGDDKTDEEMFSALPPTAWTIKVGLGQTAARYRVKDVDEVIQLLKKINGQC